MKNRWLARLIVLGGPAALAGGCSLINSYDEVKPFVDSGTGSSSEGGGEDSGPGTDGNGGNDVGTNDVNQPDTIVPQEDAAPVGIVVVAGYGNVPKDGGPDVDAGTVQRYVLSTLDPKDGTELSREALATVAAVFDQHGDNGTGTGELWYVFEYPNAEALVGIASVGPVTSAGAVVKLHTRKLDSRTGKWTELGVATVPTPVLPDTIALLNSQLAYAAYTGDGGTQLVVLSSTGGAVNADAGVLTQPLDYFPKSALGAPKQNTPGGNLTLLKGECAGDCTYSAVPYQINDTTITPGSDKPVGTVSAAAAPNSATWVNSRNFKDAIVMPAIDAGAPATVTTYNPTSSYVVDTTHSFSVPVTGTPVRFGRPAIGECFKTFFVSRTNAPYFFGIALGSGVNLDSALTNGLTLGHQTSSVAWEPYTSTALGVFNNGSDYGITPIRITGTSTISATPEQYQTRNPSTGKGYPPDLRPYGAATRNVDVKGPGCP
jgi:hypothetical protein